MDTSKMLISGAALAAGLAVAVVIRKPYVAAVGLAAAVLYFIMTLDRKEEKGKEEEEEKATAPPVKGNTLGAGSSSLVGSGGDGFARFYGPEESAKVDPSQYPVPFRVKESKFWEDPMDDRVRWHVSGPEGPYTGWRPGFF